MELKSPTDSLKVLQDKMEEYIENGFFLGLLIERKNKQVYISRPSMLVEGLENPATISGNPVLSRFILDLRNTNYL